MIPGSKAQNHDVPAQEWFYSLTIHTVSFVFDLQNDHKFQEEYIS